MEPSKSSPVRFSDIAEAPTQPTTTRVQSQQSVSTSSDNSMIRMWRQCSYWWSTALLLFATFVVIYGIAKQWNNPPWAQTRSHPVLEIAIFLALLFWIALLEGCQISIVGLQAVDMRPYEHSHPRAYRCSELVHDGANVERFLVGRQFLLLFSGFLVTRIGGAKTESFYIGDWEWSSEASQVFWFNSVLLTIVIIVPGQLVTQLVASDKMLGFLNLPFAPFWTVVMPCLAIESIGLLHSTYLLKDILCWAFSVDLGQRDPVKVMDKNALYYIRVGISSIILTFAGVFVIKGIFGLQTNISQGAGWDLLPGWGAFLITCVLILIMAGAEGLQVSALVLVTAQTSEIRASSPLAYRTCQLLYTGRNLQAFLVGRQFMVAIMIVLLSRATTYSGEHGTLVTGSDWGMGSQFVEVLLQSGFLGAVFVSTVAQLATQVTASIYPASFINNRVLNVLLRIMLMFELSGIVNSCWPLAWAFNAIARLEKDPFKSLAENALDRKESMGVPMEVRSESDLHQREFVNHEKVFKVSLV